MSSIVIPAPFLAGDLIVDFAVVDGDLKLTNVLAVYVERPGRVIQKASPHLIAHYAEEIETSIRDNFNFSLGSADEVEVE